MSLDIEKIKKAAQLSADRPFSIPEAGEEDRRYAGDEVAWLDFVGLATPSAVLDLIVDNERLRSQLSEQCSISNDLAQEARDANELIIELRKDAERYRLIKSRSNTADLDGQCAGVWILPTLPGWDDTPYSRDQKEGYSYRDSLDDSIDSVIAKRAGI